MYKVATHVFVYTSLVFGVLGIMLVLTSPDSDNDRTTFHIVLTKLLMMTVFIILPSFALSVAGKYLNGKQ